MQSAVNKVWHSVSSVTSMLQLWFNESCVQSLQ